MTKLRIENKLIILKMFKKKHSKADNKIDTNKKLKMYLYHSVI